MNKRCFLDMLEIEMHSVMGSLLVVYENRDDFLYVKGPELERQYMETFGETEHHVILEEMECELLKKKQRMIQVAINQRKPIDLDAIDAQIDSEREALLREAEGIETRTSAELNETERTELQRIYHEIVAHYHPETHPDMSKHERELFALAQNAYRRWNLEELKLIYTMLTEKLLLTDTEIEQLRRQNKAFSSESSDQINYADLGRNDIDFRLASEIYSGFVPLSEEAALSEMIESYSQQITNIQVELERKKQEFPFVAEETLCDPQKIEEYKMQLQVRLHNAQTERAKLERAIAVMMEGVC